LYDIRVAEGLSFSERGISLMPKKMKPITALAYSRARGVNLLCLSTGGVDGASVVTCHPEWHKDCVKAKLCLNFFSDGYMPRKRELARLMKKPENEVTPEDMYHEKEKLTINCAWTFVHF